MDKKWGRRGGEWSDAQPETQNPGNLGEFRAAGNIGGLAGEQIYSWQSGAGQQSRAMRLATVSATTPNMRWHMTLAAPRTRTQRPP